MIRSVHPFPARMAPDLALEKLRELPPDSLVLDPMIGSGTVARQAVALGHRAIGFDLDPLAILISKVATTPVNDEAVQAAGDQLLAAARGLVPTEITLPWLDGDAAAEAFVRYWFGIPQRCDLRRLAFLLSRPDLLPLSEDIGNVLRVALSRIIITKKQCASLAQDTSHSRPHRVVEQSDYDVFAGFSASIQGLRRRLLEISGDGTADVSLGDARSLDSVGDASVDSVLTSPPYLNAIDYMRGHRLSLIWFGHRHAALTSARSNSIGSERRPDQPIDEVHLQEIKRAMGDLSSLPSRYHGFVDRYVSDLHKMMLEVLRVLKQGATATFVMGNSCLRGVYIQNSEALKSAAASVGLEFGNEDSRDLPERLRYLPTPSGGALGKRMRKEIILTFAKA